MELNRKNVKKILFIICFAMVFFWGLNHGPSVLMIFRNLLGILAPFLIGLCFAFVINVLLRPVETLWDKISWGRGEKTMKKLKRPLCLLLSTVIIGGVIFILLFMVVPEIRNTALMIIDMFPQYMVQIERWWADLSDVLMDFAIVLPQPELNLSEIGKVAGDFLWKSGQSFVGKTVDITTSIFSVMFNVILGLVFAFYVLSQKEKLGRNLKKVIFAFLSGEKAESVLNFFALTNRIFTSFVTGQLTESVIIGSLCFLGMVILRMPYAPMISVLVGFTALIPVFGAFIGTGVGAFLILMVNPIKALWFILFIVVLQQVEGNLIYPKVVGKSVGLPGIWVLAAVTIGSSAFGVLGMLLAVPVCSVIYSVGKQRVNRKLEKKGIETIGD